jgi:hypothetical protein
MENGKWDIKTLLALAGMLVTIGITYATLQARISSLEEKATEQKAVIAKHEASLTALNSEAANASKNSALAIQSLQSEVSFIKSGVEKLVQSSMVQGAPATGKR